MRIDKKEYTYIYHLMSNFKNLILFVLNEFINFLLKSKYIQTLHIRK